MPQSAAFIGRSDAAEFPRLAVVIPCWNAEKWIARSIQSAIDQNYPALEVLVVDDGSTDRTVDIAQSFEFARLLSGHHRGAGAARNRGLFETTADYVMFLDADDYLEGEALRRAVHLMKVEAANLAFCPMAVEFSDGRRDFRTIQEPFPDPLQIFEKWLHHIWLSPCAVIWETQFIKTIGGWGEDVHHNNDDGELILRSMLHYPKIVTSRHGRGVYTRHEFPSISKRTGINALRSEFVALNRILDRVAGTPFTSRLSGIAETFYQLSLRALGQDDVEFASQCLAAARSIGFNGRNGSIANNIACALIGFERKEILAYHFRILKSRLGAPFLPKRGQGF